MIMWSVLHLQVRIPKCLSCTAKMIRLWGDLLRSFVMMSEIWLTSWATLEVWSAILMPTINSQTRQTAHPQSSTPPTGANGLRKWSKWAILSSLCVHHHFTVIFKAIVKSKWQGASSLQMLSQMSLTHMPPSSFQCFWMSDVNRNWYLPVFACQLPIHLTWLNFESIWATRRDWLTNSLHQGWVKYFRSWDFKI